MKIYYTNYLPPKGFLAINLFGIIVGRKDGCKLTKYDINHERIHTAQMTELLWILFYLFYFLEWLFRVVQYQSLLKGYYNISFEREAYKYGNDLEYLKNRKRFAFVKYYRLR